MLTDRDSAIVILFASLTALGLALVAEYGFALLPCPLCLYQRLPYAAAALLALPMLGVRLSRRLRGLLLALCGLAFLVGCSGGIGGAKTVEDLIAQLNRPISIPACDQVAWSLFGVSMAGYNLLASLGLAGFAGLAAWHRGERRR